MNNNFIFHGVGQGLFYSGHLNNKAFNFIFDCGVDKKEEYLNNEIDTLPNNIDFLVISHFHKDHISGLPTLLKKKKINKIYIPYFDVNTYKNVFILNLIVNNIYPGSVYFEIITKLYKCNIDINYDNIEFDLPKEINYDNIEFDLPKEINYISNSLHINENSYDWNFLFYNLSINDEKLKYLNEEIEKILNRKTIENYFKSNGCNYDEIAKIFSSTFKNINLSSIVMLHYGNAEITKKSLLTGDVRMDEDLNNRLLKQLNSDDEVYFQVPHHGAKNEWEAVSKKIINQSIELIISFGITNSYHHPNLEIIVDYNRNKKDNKLIYVVENYNYSYNI